ncbi:hypothetical protein H6P81_005652 [Aristolochia fimbriata]|uniref:QWRF motif-containing protein 3 n=1 Tax=Aristolochia fimbriata TaxID=158543 RepID=A0AAV7EZK6_ARIFI|nr:hypothetical protein H6P81_005652 [Aristolochia fimbriata]
MQGESGTLRRLRSREVSSRYLSPILSSPTRSGIPSPNRVHSPSKKNASVSEQRKSIDEVGAMRGGLWPSASATPSTPEKMVVSTLADHLGTERLMDLEKRKGTNKSILSKQKSSLEISRFDERKKDETKESAKENRPVGGSMRYASNFQISAASPPPRRVSVDVKPPRRKSDTFCDLPSSESEGSEIFYGTDFQSPSFERLTSFSSSSSHHLSPTSSSRKSGIKVSSRFMSQTNKGSDFGENSLSNNSVSAKTLIKRSNSSTSYGSSMSQWALAPARTSPSPIYAENTGKPIQSFSSLSPIRSKTKGTVGSFFSLGLELLKGKKSSTSSLTNDEMKEMYHKLRILHSRLLQWRFVNAKTEIVNESRRKEAETTLLGASLGLSKLQDSVIQKRIQLEKEKLEMKVNNILSSQSKPLEIWTHMEREHNSALSETKDSLRAVVCRIPLIDGAELDKEKAYVALHHASDLSMSINSIVNNSSIMVETTAPLLSELAKVVVRERCLLEESHELLDVLANQELQERSLRCQLIQLYSQI